MVVLDERRGRALRFVIRATVLFDNECVKICIFWSCLLAVMFHVFAASRGVCIISQPNSLISER